MNTHSWDWKTSLTLVENVVSNSVHPCESTTSSKSADLEVVTDLQLHYIASRSITEIPPGFSVPISLSHSSWSKEYQPISQRFADSEDFISSSNLKTVFLQHFHSNKLKMIIFLRGKGSFQSSSALCSFGRTFYRTAFVFCFHNGSSLHTRKSR